MTRDEMNDFLKRSADVLEEVTGEPQDLSQEGVQQKIAVLEKRLAEAKQMRDGGPK